MSTSDKCVIAAAIIQGAFTFLAAVVALIAVVYSVGMAQQVSSTQERQCAARDLLHHLDTLTSHITKKRRLPDGFIYDLFNSQLAIQVQCMRVGSELWDHLSFGLALHNLCGDNDGDLPKECGKRKFEWCRRQERITSSLIAAMPATTKRSYEKKYFVKDKEIRLSHENTDASKVTNWL